MLKIFNSYCLLLNLDTYQSCLYYQTFIELKIWHDCHRVKPMNCYLTTLVKLLLCSDNIFYIFDFSCFMGTTEQITLTNYIIKALLNDLIQPLKSKWQLSANS